MFMTNKQAVETAVSVLARAIRAFLGNQNRRLIVKSQSMHIASVLSVNLG